MTEQQTTWSDWFGADVVGFDGNKIGSLENVYVDAGSRRPTWMGVKTGFLGLKETLVPIEGVTADGEALRVAFTEEQVKDAPNVDPEHGELDRGDESEIYRHYGLSRGADDDRTGNTGAAASDDEATMTRSEEELEVGTRRTEGGKVRLTKHVVTENVTTTVPVRKEVARIVREPVTDGDGSATIDEDEEEIVLSQEEVVTGKKVVEKERVHLAKDVETEQREVSGEIRKERIDIDEDDATSR